MATGAIGGDFEEMTLSRDGLTVSFEHIGEGRDGDYDPEDPDDAPLLRFYVSREIPGEPAEDLEGASYCTRLETGTSPDLLRAALEHIHERVSAKLADPASNGSVRSVCAELSWLDEARLAELAPASPSP